jgi:serine/threonine protein kinase
MNTEQKNEESIFKLAFKIKSPTERSAYLKKACGDDNVLLARVEALLKASDKAGSFLDSPPVGSIVTLDDSPLSEGPGTKIGRYKLLQQIGEGGFGVVYMAEQEQPIRRRVALKIIKLGMDTKQVIARFEAERQALALMDHPNIAHVFDAGTTDTGRPYFVMELVKGVPITEYCDSNNLSTDERLRLFIDVCRAVQHAHQKGIIHRDIKPTNVMITLRDGVPVPKVIDFGIAKATQQRLTEKTLFTEFRQFIGTPEYMSPEQAEMSELDVDTRSDIYSLGVLLYELLTGTTPFDANELRSAAFDEIVRIIREAEPPKPSTRLSTLGDTLGEVARHRHVGPGQLCKIVRGELDWIVMRTLEKDRTRRYETANGLVMDIERYMNDEPVMAGPPSTAYRLKKFLRRNKTSVILASSIAAALVVGLCLATIGFIQASRQRDKAVAAEAEAIAAKSDVVRQRDLAEEQRQRAEANLSFALDALDNIYLEVSEEQLPKEQLIEKADRKLLEKALEFYERFAEENSDNTTLREETAQAYGRVGIIELKLDQFERAEQALRTAIAMYEQLTGEFPDVPKYRSNLADAQTTLGIALRLKGKLDEAEKAHHTVMAMYEELASDFPDEPVYQSDLAGESVNLGNVLLDKGELDEAEKAYRNVIAIHEKLVSKFPDVPKYRSRLALGHINLGVVLDDKGKFDEATQAYNRSSAILEELVSEFPDNSEYRSNLASSHSNLGRALLYEGRLDEAEQAYRNAIVTYKELVREFPGVPRYRSRLGYSNISLGIVLNNKGKLDEAEQAYRNAIVTYEELVREFPDVPKYRSVLAISHSNLGRALREAGRLDEAEKATHTAIAIREELASEFPDVPEYRSGLALGHSNLGNVLYKKGKLDEAEKAYRNAIAIRQELVSEFADNPKYRSSLANSANSLAWHLVTNPDISPSDAAGAVELAEKAVQAVPEESMYWNTLGVAHYRAGSWEDTITTLRKSRDLGTGWHEGIDLFFLAMAQFQLGGKDEGRRNYFKAVEWTQQNKPGDEELRRFGVEAAELLGIPDMLGISLKLNRQNWAAGIRADVVERATRACEITNWQDHGYLNTLAAAYSESGDFENAVKWQKEAIKNIPQDMSSKWNDTYEYCLGLYEAKQPYHTGHPWNFSNGRLVACWDFVQSEEGTVVDSSGNGLKGKLIGGAKITEDPQRGKVLDVDGDGKYVDCGDSWLFDISGSITISALINAKSWTKEIWRGYIVSKDDWEIGINGYSLRCGENGRLSFVLGIGIPNGWPEAVSAPNSMVTNKWYHVAGTYDGKSIKVYINGLLSGSSEQTGTINLSNYDLNIGRGAFKRDRLFYGLIDDVRIYSYALSQAEIAALAAESNPELPTVGKEQEEKE